MVANTPVAIAWFIDDADGESGEHRVDYAWDYAGEAEAANWQPVAMVDGQAFVQPETLQRGDGRRAATLALRAQDADGNYSEVVVQAMAFVAPRSYLSLATTVAGALGAGLLLVLVGLVVLARNSGLPVALLARQSPRRWLEVGLGYRRYYERWQELTPLERLLLLLTPAQGETTSDGMLEQLAVRQIPVNEGRLQGALDGLVRGQFVRRAGALCQAVEPVCNRMLQADVGAAGLGALATQVRTEHPLFAAVRQFFPAAGFTVQPLAEPLALLCVPATSLWQRRLGEAAIYARLFPDGALDNAGVTALGVAARQYMAQNSAEAPRLVLALIDQTPSDSGWIGIGALRAEGMQVVPVDDALMQGARIDGSEARTLQVHIQRFMGRERDLFNVRDPVADRLNFFGRERRCDELLDGLAEGRPLALFGLRKMGKSSLLQVMRERAPFPVAHVDLQAGMEPQGLYERIVQEWQAALRVRHPEVAWQPPALTGDPSTAFTAAARALLGVLAAGGVEPRLGLFVDEFDLLMPGQGGSQDETVLAHYLAITRALRGLVQETGQLALLVAGVDARFNRVNRWGAAQNPFYQFFQEEYLEPLSAEDCVQMVRNIGRQMGLVFSEEAAGYVATVSGGHPFLARQLCSTALGLRSQEESALELDLVQRAAERFVRNPGTAANLDEQGLWGEVTNPTLWPPAQIVENSALLQSLAQMEEASEDALLDAGQDRGVRQQSLYELTQRWVLQRMTATVRIHLGLFRTWIRTYKAG